MMIKVPVKTASHRQMIDITAEVDRALAELDAGQGVCHVFVPHTTAAVVINENADPDVQRDLLAAWERLIPDIRFAHGEGNSDAHFLSTLLGASVTVPVRAGRLALGTWQSIFFVELDGPRNRTVWVSMV